MRRLTLLAVALACVLTGVAQAQVQLPTVEGRWAMRTGGRAILTIEIDCAGPGDRDCRGVLTRPEHGTMNNLGAFQNAWGMPVTRAFRVDVTAPGRGVLVLAPKLPGGETDRVLFEVSGIQHASMQPQGAPIAPVPLARARAGEAVTAGWNRWRTHAVDHNWPTSVQAKQLFEDDQAARRSETIDWNKVSADDALRRTRMRELLDAGQLRSGDDFYHAAFVFQHGSTPDDHLLAHTFAVIAAARGRSDAAWIAAASMDRYLQNIGRPQVFGTQYQTPFGEGATTQEPYDRKLVSDALRSALGVPALAIQEQRRAEMDRGRHKH